MTKHERQNGLNAHQIAELQQPRAYPQAVQLDATEVVLQETHISWVFLIGQFAYKVKKPIKNDFVDYSTLARRERFCHKELTLDRRFAESLYLDVVPISLVDGKPCVEGPGRPIEFAVKMHRFAHHALLGERIAHRRVSANDITTLAKVIADFHLKARRSAPESKWASPDLIYHDAIDNLHTLDDYAFVAKDQLRTLTDWTKTEYDRCKPMMAQRRTDGFVRECHGDLHANNIICLDGIWMPFDGVEFNERFHWIDVLSDAAFLGMDLQARGRHDLSHVFLNTYLEHTGDYRSLDLLRWYLVYRSLVRAKVDAIRGGQSETDEAVRQTARQACIDHVALAMQLSHVNRPSLTITYGVSGSGKTTRSETLVKRYGAIRVRSDVERKRRLKQETDSPAEQVVVGAANLYSDIARAETYDQLQHLAQAVLNAGFSVIVDATFLQQAQRTAFQRLAHSSDCEYRILQCKADNTILQQRLARRAARGGDASDADASVLWEQQKLQEPLTDAERAFVLRTDGT